MIKVNNRSTISVVGRKIDVDDLLDSAGVAELAGLANANAVSVYRSRFEDFPQPVIDKGRCLLWLRADVEAWRSEHPGRG